MLTRNLPARQLPTTDAHTCAAVLPLLGVGIDTSRYGHYAVFLREDLNPAAAELAFAESSIGYGQLRQRLEQIVQRQGPVHFGIRLDAAGQYADNLLHFLHGLANGLATGKNDEALSRCSVTLSCGDPQRNKNYRAALFGGKKSDPIEARAAARYALSERPCGITPMAAELRTLRQVAGRLQGVVRQRTRLINQFHHLLALSFPELALLVKDISIGWVLELCTRYPTARLLAKASVEDLAAIPYLPHGLIDRLRTHAQSSIASLCDEAMAELVRDQVRQLREVVSRQKRLENMLKDAYHRLPAPNHLDSIPGIGEVTAAILTAFILDIDRFASPAKLVAYFGVLPIEAASGVDRDGKPRGPKRHIMSRRGNDLVRRYLWMAALSAVRFNPAVRALYARVVAKHPERKAIAIGHAMRKLLHLAYAIWKTGKPFNKKHYAWEADSSDAQAQNDIGMSLNAGEEKGKSEQGAAKVLQEQAAGHKQSAKPAEKVVAAAYAESVAHVRPASEDNAKQPHVDFAHLKAQLTMSQLLDHLGLTERLRGKVQRRGPCPIHRGDGRGRTFSVNLKENVFQCFDAACSQKGDIIDLWAAMRQMSLREAALDLIATFGLEPASKRTEKRNG